MIFNVEAFLVRCSAKVLLEKDYFHFFATVISGILPDQYILIYALQYLVQ